MEFRLHCNASRLLIAVQTLFDSSAAVSRANGRLQAEQGIDKSETVRSARNQFELRILGNVARLLSGNGFHEI
jgi:hypothetical protein